MVNINRVRVLNTFNNLKSTIFVVFVFTEENLEDHSIRIQRDLSQGEFEVKNKLMEFKKVLLEGCKKAFVVWVMSE